MIYCAAEDYMARGRSSEDVSTLEMALIGFTIEKQKIESRIQEIQSQLKGKRSAMPSGAAGAAPVKKRHLSESARKRIAAAQKRRWAEHRKRAALAAKGQTAKAGGAAS
jgi:predicted  nucleic acid-binding Zn-ribbon protein